MTPNAGIDIEVLKIDSEIQSFVTIGSQIVRYETSPFNLTTSRLMGSVILKGVLGELPFFYIESRFVLAPQVAHLYRFST